MRQSVPPAHQPSLAQAPPGQKRIQATPPPPLSETSSVTSAGGAAGRAAGCCTNPPSRHHYRVAMIGGWDTNQQTQPDAPREDDCFAKPLAQGTDATDRLSTSELPSQLLRFLASLKPHDIFRRIDLSLSERLVVVEAAGAHAPLSIELPCAVTYCRQRNRASSHR